MEPDVEGSNLNLNCNYFRRLPVFVRWPMAAILAGVLVAACGDKPPEADAQAPPPPKRVEAPPKPAAPKLVADNAPKPGASTAAPSAPVLAAPKSAGGSGALAVVVSTPRGKVEGPVRPTIVFDKPVRALGALVDDEPAVAEIVPAIEGRWRWLGSSVVEFVPAKPAPLSTAYSVRVPAGLAALDGSQLGDDAVFTFETPRLRALAGDPVSEWRRFAWARLDQRFQITFNQRPEPKAVERHVYVRAAGTSKEGERIALTLLRAETPHEQAVRQARDRGDKPPKAPSASTAPIDRRVVVELQPARPLALNTAYELVISRDLTSSEGPLPPEKIQVWPFRTYGPLAVKTAECNRWHGACPNGPLTLVLTNPVTAKALASALKLAPSVEIRWPDNRTSEQSTWALHGRFKPASHYTIRVGEGLTDIFGQPIAVPYEAIYRTGDFSPALWGRGDRALLERAHRAALPITHVNVPQLDVEWARLTPSTALSYLKQPWQKQAPPGASQRSIDLGRRPNTWTLTPLDLDSLFEPAPAGKTEMPGQLAWVRMSWPVGKHRRNETVVIQRTGLGVYLKVAPTSTHAYVWQLSNGTSAAGATVELVDEHGTVLAQGRASTHGVAELPGIAELAVPQTNRRGYPLMGPPFLAARVRLGDDVSFATTAETWHLSAWRFGLKEAWDARPPRASGLVFTDRGIYRPGERVHVKAILRERSLGQIVTPSTSDLTVSLLDPDGKTLATQSPKLTAFGTFSTAFDLPKQGRLGHYRVDVREGKTKLEWGTSLRMAEYRAPEFLVSVKPHDDSRLSGQPVKAVVEGRYLFGGAMAGAEVRWSMHSAPGRFEPENADGFVFGRRFNWWDEEDTGGGGSAVASGAWTLDDNGQHTVDAGPAETPTDRPLQYTVEAAVTDVNRQVVAGRTQFMVHPAALYVGIKGPSGFATAGEPFTVSVIARDALTQARVGGSSVSVKLQQHVWNTVHKQSATGTFTTHSEKQIVDRGYCIAQIETDKEATCTFTAPESGYYEVLAEGHDKADRNAATTDGLWVGGPGYAAWMQDDDHRVEIVSDRAGGTYDVGDRATLLVQSPFPEAEAWVTVEREGVLSQRRMRLKGTATPIHIDITEEMIPNVFVGVVLTRGRIAKPGKRGDPGRPAFRAGYKELRVVPTQKRLTLTLEPDAPEKRPGSELSIQVQVADRQGAGVRSEITVWAVDEGVLALTGYKAPDPIDALYQPRGLSVRQATNLAHLVPQLVYGEKGKSMGGGGGAAAAAMSLRSRFVTTPIFIGEAITGKDGKATVKGTLPDNLTTFRLMGVAITRDHRGGRGQSRVVVNKPLMARPALPRATRTGDRFAAGVVLHSQAGEPLPVAITAAVDGPIELLEPGTRTLTIPPLKGTEIRFSFRATGEGEAKLRFTVEGGDHTDAVEAKLPVHRPVSMETVATYGDLEVQPDGSGRVVEGIETPDGVRPDQGGLEISLASTALVGLGEGVRQLVDYPYGCLEQQSSRLVPFVALRSIVDQYRAEWLDGRDPTEIVNATVKALASLQQPDGGFRYWPSSKCAHYWGSAQATLALGEAQRAGYPVPKEVLERARGYIRARWESPAPCEHAQGRRDEARAFGAYVLARQNAAVRAFHQQLFKRRDKLALFGRALLAHAVAIDQPGSEGLRTLTTELMNHARVTPAEVHFEETDGATYAPLFHSDTRTTSLVLQALLAAEPDHPFVSKIARYLVKVRKGGRYRSTQEAGFSLTALADYARIREAAAPDYVAEVHLTDKVITSERFDAKGLDQWRKWLPMHELPTASGGVRSMTFSGRGRGRLYYSAALRYAPAELPTQARDEGIVVQRWYTPFGGEGQIRSVNEGDLIDVRVRVATAQERHYVVVDDPLPSGLEALDTRLATTAQTTDALMAPSDPNKPQAEALEGQAVGRWYSVFNHVESRDDRMLLFADHLPPGVHTFRYAARATTAGTFVLKPAHAEEMYTPEVFGRSDGGTFWVHPRARVGMR